MHIVPLVRPGLVAALRVGVQGDAAGPIKQAASAVSIHPGGSATPCHVSPPGRVRASERGATITRAGARASDPLITTLVMQGHGLGELTFLAMKRGHPAPGLLPLPEQPKATSVGAAMLALPQLKEMFAAAHAIGARRGPARGPASANRSQLYLAIAERVPADADPARIHALMNGHLLSLG